MRKEKTDYQQPKRCHLASHGRGSGCLGGDCVSHCCGLGAVVLENYGWGTDSEDIIPLDTSREEKQKRKYIISPILWVYVVVLIIDHASRDHSIINTQPQTTALDCL